MWRLKWINLLALRTLYICNYWGSTTRIYIYEIKALHSRSSSRSSLQWAWDSVSTAWLSPPRRTWALERKGKIIRNPPGNKVSPSFLSFFLSSFLPSRQTVWLPLFRVTVNTGRIELAIDQPGFAIAAIYKRTYVRTSTWHMVRLVKLTKLELLTVVGVGPFEHYKWAARFHIKSL